MAKSKPKKVKRLPPRVVVVNPWSSDPEDISAWFELMLRDHGYPDTRANIVFHRKNNGSKIVELPKEVKDVSMCLGTHYHSSFLKDRTHSADFSIIYEYKNSYADDPGENNWTEVYPSERPIPDNFPVKYPYPLPLPPLELSVASVDSEYACFPSSENRKRMEDRMNAQAPQAQAVLPQSAPVASTSTLSKNSRGPSAGSSSCATFAPLESVPFSNRTRNSAESSKQIRDPILNGPRYASKSADIKKMDPYEEEQVIEELFRSLSPVKKSEADEFLGSVLSGITTEVPSSRDRSTQLQEPDDEDDYKPSEDLLAMFDTLMPENGLDTEVHSPQFIKPEPFDAEVPEAFSPHQAESRDDYQPSADLLALFDQSHLEGRTPPSINSEVSIKPEPVDAHIPFYEEAGSLSQGSSRTASRTPIVKHWQEERAEVQSRQGSIYRASGSQDPRLHPRIKLEQDGQAVNVLSSRTPSSTTYSMLQYKTPGRPNKRIESEPDRHRDREYSPAKRVKTEFEEG